MEQVTNDDFDFLLIHYKKKFNQKSEKKIKYTEEMWKEQDFGMGFSVQIPSEFEQADEESASAVFWSERRPKIILTTLKREEGFTFQFLNDEIAEETLLDCRNKIQQMIEKVDERCVFYNAGEEAEAVWFDYKSFAKNEAVYNLVFLFQADGRKVLGTFFCIFEAYDKWRPMVLKMLGTVKTKGETNERL